MSGKKKPTTFKNKNQKNNKIDRNNFFLSPLFSETFFFSISFLFHNFSLKILQKNLFNSFPQTKNKNKASNNKNHFINENLNPPTVDSIFLVRPVNPDL